MNSKNNERDEDARETSSGSVTDIFKRYQSSLKYFIAGYLVNPQDVDDVCQETFLRTYKSSLEKEVKTPKSFMFRVAKNLIISDFRKSATKLNEYVEDIDVIDSCMEIDDLEHNALAQEKLGIMCEAIAGLPNKCRQAVVMRKVYGLSTKDIAKRMNITTTTVSNYITKGMCTYNEAVIKYNEEHNYPTKHDLSTPTENGRTL
ncbi:RNA polymerase sigma factor [Thalassotalea sp. ND16A]|uniref:RNA polymerase sigma factor n=1 Tax=Thalassotalea sp. ND16A TaxID=1535422 RepID=UPI00051A64A6|nr:RNA polymerase sigma factor [Thalassotalea sp. ND16A]KGK00106.1 RNA polymerase, sigma-24 subunit, ECF subfamily [Thalassotalea sp. ND16A]